MQVSQAPGWVPSLPEGKGGALPSPVLKASPDSFLPAQRLFWPRVGELRFPLGFTKPKSPTGTLLWGRWGELGAALTLCSSAASSAQSRDVSLCPPPPPTLYTPQVFRKLPSLHPISIPYPFFLSL